MPVASKSLRITFAAWRGSFSSIPSASEASDSMADSSCDSSMLAKGSIMSPPGPGAPSPALGSGRLRDMAKVDGLRDVPFPHFGHAGAPSVLIRLDRKLKTVWQEEQ
jgi:hypothetical protein